MMDPEKLARIRALSKRRLRDELQNTWLKDYYDPVTEEDSEDTDKPFSGIFTFFRAPRTRSLDNIDIALIGVPFDLGVTNRAGARHGPGQIGPPRDIRTPG